MGRASGARAELLDRLAVEAVEYEHGDDAENVDDVEHEDSMIRMPRSRDAACGQLLAALTMEYPEEVARVDPDDSLTAAAPIQTRV
jgi:hypothetical protein